MGTLWQKYRDYVLYVVFGVMTTVVNIVAYWCCAHVLGLGTLASNVIAWFLAVLFAYLSNRSLVFHSAASSASEVLREAVSFFAGRLATGALDWAIMVACVDYLHFPDVPVKLASNVIVVILNFVISKLIVFAKR